MATTDGKDGRPERKVGYCARLKECASRTCWGLGKAVAAEETLPDPNTHTFPLFEGTNLTAAERAKLRHAEILFDESLPKLKDRGEALSGRVRVTQGVVRYPGLASTAGKEEDRKPGGDGTSKSAGGERAEACSVA